WRRTVSGWQRLDTWPTAASSPRSISWKHLPHPGVVALLELLCAGLCLVASQSAEDKQRNQAATGERDAILSIGDFS
ncbi:MAG TPA: hypothetical protein VKB78_14820, partial [Pirellulales bacterium]|nr:hypothetical protein [Pirellulales bacterium]